MTISRFNKTLATASAVALIGTGVVAPNASAATATIDERGNCEVTHEVNGAEETIPVPAWAISLTKGADEISNKYLGDDALNILMKTLGLTLPAVGQASELIGSAEDNMDLALSATAASSGNENSSKANEDLTKVKAVTEAKNAFKACLAGENYSTQASDSSSGSSNEFDNSSRNQDGSLTTGTIVAIVLGVIAAVVGVGAAMFPQIQHMLPR